MKKGSPEGNSTGELREMGKPRQRQSPGQPGPGVMGMAVDETWREEMRAPDNENGRGGLGWTRTVCNVSKK